MNIGELLSLPELKNDLVRVDAALRTAVTAGNPLLTEVATHLIAAGGKRLRPSMVIAAAMSCSEGPVTENVVQGASAIELVHIGSLYHDDVLDDAETRRGVPSVNAKWGNFMAIISGDYLLARACAISARLGTEVTGLVSDTIADLCQGQVEEHQTVFDIERSIEAYERSIAGKTASLIATGARIGALMSAAPDQRKIEALTTFAYAFGMAFQIRDDILDITQTDEQLGKPAGNDIVEGVYTLPVIYALSDPRCGAQIASHLGGPIDTATRDEVRNLIRNSSAITAATDVGRGWAKQAVEAISDLDSAMAAHLVEMADDLFEA